MSNEKLAEALRACMDVMLERGVPTHPDADARVAYTMAEEALQAHAAEVAQAQAKAPVSMPDVDTMVTRFLSWRLPKSFAPDAGISFKPMPDIYMPHCWPIGTNLFDAGQAKEMILHMLGDDCAAATQPQAAEPVAVIESAEDRHGPYLTHANVVLRVWNGYVPKAGDEIYTHPQPAQGAKDEATIERVARAIYEHVFTMSIPRMGVRSATFEEVWAIPSERERLTAQACAAIDAAMAKESGR